jgi:hypothetical protein
VTALTVTVRAPRGRTLATWRVRATPATNHLSFRLPPRAAQARRIQLQLAWPGGHRTLIVVRSS